MKPKLFSFCVLLYSACCAEPASAAETLAQCSPDGTHTVSIGEHGRILYCRANEDRVEHTFYICNAQALAFSEDGKLLAAAGGRNGSQSKVKVWRLADRKPLSEIVIGGEGITTLAISSDEKIVAAANRNGTVEAWSVADGQRRWSRKVSSMIHSIRFTADGTQLVIEHVDGTQRLLDPAKGRNAIQAGVAKK